MTELATGWTDVLVDWSLRWGLLILVLMAMTAAGMPRAVAARLWLGRLVLIGGLLLPFSPGWWNAPWPAVSQSAPAVVGLSGAADGPMSEDPARSPDKSTMPRPAGIARTEAPNTTEPRIGRWTAIIAMANWRTVAAYAWLIGCGFFLIRQAAGWWWLARIRRAATPIRGTLFLEMQAVREKLGVRRRVEFLTSPRVGGPALFAGLTPAVVVPADWATWSVEDRRAALIHELTHVANLDDWSGVIEEFIRAAFFFHPLVRWLLIRLARDREKRCDAAVVRGGVVPRRLTQLLLDGVKRLGAGQSVLSATPMFNRSSAKERIHQLLEADMTRWSKPLSRTRAVLTAAAVICLCAALGGYGAKADPPAANGPGQPVVAEFRGTVSDSEGRGIAGATVFAVGDVGNGERLMTTSDADGRFSFAGLPLGKTAFPAVLVVAFKAGRPPASTVVEAAKVKSVALTMSPATAYYGSVKDASGRPIAGAEVQVGFVHRTTLSSRGKGSSWGYLADAAIRGTAAEPFYFTKTDASGAFEFSQLPADSELIFRVVAKGWAELDTGAGGPKEGQYVATADSKPAQLVLLPEAIIRGRITSGVPGLSLDAAVVKIEGTKTLHGFHRSVKPDADGQFTAAGLPAGPMSVILDVPPDVPACAAGESVTTEAGKTSEVSLKMISGVEVTGRVVVRDGNEPVPGVHMATNGLVNPGGFHWPAKPTDADGRFSLRLPPGKVTVMVWSTPGKYRQTDFRRQEIEVPSNAIKFEIGEPFEVGKVGVVATASVKPGAIGGPLPVAAERNAAAIVRQLGGWYVLDGDGHVVEVNMVYHQGPDGKRLDNRLTDSDGALRAAGSFPRLKKIYLQREQATDSGFASLVGLADLESLFVWDAVALTDAGLAHLANLPKLRFIHFSNGRIGDASLALLGRIPSIQELSLQGNSISDQGLKHLAGMKQLTSLWVGMSKLPITDAGARHLAGLTALQQLDLQSAQLTAAGVAALKDLTQLQTLYLSTSKDGDTGGDGDIEPLLGMKNLRSLWLGNSRLTAGGVRRLMTVPNLRDLALTSATIGKETQDELKKEHPHVRLDISGPTDKP